MPVNIHIKHFNERSFDIYKYIVANLKSQAIKGDFSDRAISPFFNLYSIFLLTLNRGTSSMILDCR